MKRFLSKLFEDVLSLPFGIAIVFLAIFLWKNYNLLVIGFWILIAIMIIRNLLKKD